MSETASKKLHLGVKAPQFSLLNPKLNQHQSLEALQGRQGTVIIFMCNHCPYVVHILPKLVELADLYQQKGVQFIGINSNDADAYPADAPDKMVELIHRYNIPFPYLFDEDQAAAKNYQAACTPDIYLFDASQSLYYHGQFDPSRPGSPLDVTGQDLKMALDHLIEHLSAPQEQRPSVGCNIKWKN